MSLSFLSILFILVVNVLTMVRLPNLTLTPTLPCMIHWRFTDGHPMLFGSHWERTPFITNSQVSFFNFSDFHRFFSLFSLTCTWTLSFQSLKQSDIHCQNLVPSDGFCNGSAGMTEMVWTLFLFNGFPGVQYPFSIIHPLGWYY